MNPSQEPASPQHYEQPYEPPPAYPYGAPAEVLGWEPLRPRRRPLRRTVLVALSVTATMAIAGAPLGLLWAWLAPSVPVINAGQNGIVVNDPSPEEYIAADGWFTLLGFAFGLIAAILTWLILRRDRGPGLLLGVAFGGLASALVAWWLGRTIGLSAWNTFQDSSAAGDTFSRPPDLHAHGALLVIAFAGVIVTTLLAGWSNDPDLELPGAKPGYGHDLANNPNVDPADPAVDSGDPAVDSGDPAVDSGDPAVDSGDPASEPFRDPPRASR